MHHDLFVVDNLLAVFLDELLFPWRTGGSLLLPKFLYLHLVVLNGSAEGLV